MKTRCRNIDAIKFMFIQILGPDRPKRRQNSNFDLNEKSQSVFVAGNPTELGERRLKGSSFPQEGLCMIDTIKAG